MNLHVGCAGFALPQRRYHQDFDLVEVQQTFYQPPRVATAEKWRAAAPNHFQFAIKAWQLITHEPTSPGYRRLTTPIPPSHRGRYGGFRLTDEVLAAWDVTRAVGLALRAPIVLFQTPPSFTPTQAHRRDLERFFGRIPRDFLRLFWEPRGLWEPKEAAALCRELELGHCIDPLQQKPTEGEVAYFRLHGLGANAERYGELELEKVLLACADRAVAYVIFNNRDMASDAARFSALARAELAP
jgi:uncharacterized protein YecE (DUF72 family)